MIRSMLPSTPTISNPTPVRRAIVSLAVMVMLSVACAMSASAQLLVTVTADQNISFGRVVRSTTSTIDYSSSRAARFTVTGRQGRRVRIVVLSTNLSQGTGLLPISISTSNCAYSIDGGDTWTAFSNGTLYQDVTIPNGTRDGASGSILLRVGGTVTADPSQSRGDYFGTITVTAVYLP